MIFPNYTFDTNSRTKITGPALKPLLTTNPTLPFSFNSYNKDPERAETGNLVTKLRGPLSSHCLQLTQRLHFHSTLIIRTPHERKLGTS
jgi:hypothetical protein